MDYPAAAQRNAELPMGQIFARLREIWLRQGPPGRSSQMLAEIFEVTPQTISAWCSSSPAGSRRPPDWAIARLLLLTDRELIIRPERGLVIRRVQRPKPTEPESYPNPRARTEALRNQ